MPPGSVTGDESNAPRAAPASVDYRRWPIEVLGCLRHHLPESLLEVILGAQEGTGDKMHPGAWYLTRARPRLIDALCRRCEMFLGTPDAEKVRVCLKRRSESSFGETRGGTVSRTAATSASRGREARARSTQSGTKGRLPATPASWGREVRARPTQSGTKGRLSATRGSSRGPAEGAGRGLGSTWRRASWDGARDGARGGALRGEALQELLADVRISCEQDIQSARTAALAAAQRAGASVTSRTRAATVVSELARNIVRYAGTGSVRLRVSARGLRIEAEDEGPGIAHLDEILSGRYRSKTGMGLGLIGTRRLAEEFHVETGEGRGTRVTAVLSLR